MWVPVLHIDYETLSGGKHGESTEDVLARVIKGRKYGGERFSHASKSKPNRELSPQEVEDHAKLTPATKELMNKLASQFMLSPRAYHRVLRVARSIADLEGKDAVEQNHIMEAFQYRPKIYSQ
jgi:magnesium chelatase family protein